LFDGGDIAPIGAANHPISDRDAFHVVIAGLDVQPGDDGHGTPRPQIVR
jgi:hypothetical protein